MDKYADQKDLVNEVKADAKESYLQLARMLEKELTREKPDLDKYIEFKNSSPEELRQKAAKL